jgi:SNF2 family DNA or RNA helicase
MPLANIENGEITVATEYRDKHSIKSIPGAKWSQTGSWRLPLSWASCVALRGVFGDRLEIGPELGEWAWQEKTNRIDPSMRLRSAIEAEGDDRLFPPQRAGVEWLRATKRGLLGDPMGTGKTRQLLMAIPDDGWPAIVVTPNGVRTGWRDEVDKLGLFCEVRILDGSAAKRKKTLEGIEDGDRVLVVVNWEALRSLSRLASYGSINLNKCVAHGGEDPAVTETRCEVHPKALNTITWRTVIRDEAHRAKDPTSKQTRASWALQHAPTVRYCWDATGTPVAQHMGDLWAIMHGNSPEDFPRKSTFIDRYATATWNSWGSLDIGGVNPSMSDELFSFLDPRFRHVPKEVLLPFLPAKVRQEWTCTMAPKQKKAYDDMAKTMIAELESGVLITTNALAQYSRLMQFASAYAEIGDDGEVQLQAPSCKVDALMEILESLGEEPVAVGMVSRQLLELCAEQLRKADIPFSVVSGGQTMAEREKSINDFQNKRVRVILLTVQSGGTGITLTTAPYLVMLQRSWSLVDNMQTEDRVHRIGSEQHAQVTIIDVLTEGTMEVGRQIERLQEKGANLNEILRDTDNMKKVLYGEAMSQPEDKVSE